MASVALEGVAFRYGANEVLRGVDAVVPAGRTVALYGRSGSGKTTLLNLIAGLDRPSRGRIRVGETVVSSLSDAEATEYRRRNVGIVFQSYGLISHLTAVENVLFSMRLAGVERSLWRDRCDWALDAVGLAKRGRHRPAELSGGERQRVAIARVLAVAPPLILADEPTGALDHATGLRMVDLLAHHVRQAGAALWMATHDPSLRERVDVAFRMADGHLDVEKVGELVCNA